ncbi:MAG TPA: SGNH/GDSL hydrolase family protein [Vicinamibacterales bacterium]|nr:SGNH/GDSL hydrolase family protein [Vicinamibacterales bacterium]
MSDGPAPRQWRRFKAACEAGVVLAFGVVFFPATDAKAANKGDYPFRYLHDGALAMCADEGVPYLDLLESYSAVKDPRTLWVSPFDAHPNAAANRRGDPNLTDS